MCSRPYNRGLVEEARRQNLERTLQNLHQALEKVETALIEFEEGLRGESAGRPKEE